MFVLDGAKARIAALAMAAATAVPLLPSAAAEHATIEPKAATTQALDVDPPTKTKKKSANERGKHAPMTRRPMSAWAPPTLADAIRPKVKSVDPLKIVLAVAKQQLGKPYRYGATGPSSFDCSGFTGYVWRKAGVSLPRTSGAQYNALPHVPKSKARLGDLVYSPGHIGLYIGDGQMIHSPHSGRTVEIAPIHGNVHGFARPKAKS